ncbi:hypothetical protein Z046_31590 [Pseudomonas aeruginosa VRFPA09]|nr:hypothetical protein Z046_31590 [Pseudomonas aeruginosa VRFPA09]
MPMFEELISTPVMVSTSRRATSWMVCPSMVIQPGATLTWLFSSNLPEASAADMLNGLITEPGSKVSVRVRLRMKAGAKLARLFGL